MSTLRALSYMILSLILMLSFYVALVPLHEGLHWLQDDIDPHMQPLRIVYYTDECYRLNALGLTYYTYDTYTPEELRVKCTLQEIVCYSTCLIVQELCTVALLMLIHRYTTKNI